MNIDFTSFLYDHQLTRKKYRVKIYRFVHSIISYVLIILQYRKEGESSAIGQITRLRREKDEGQTYSSQDYLVYAAKLIPIYRIFGKLVRQSDLCLERSIALTYALIDLGIPAVLVIGKAQYYINEYFTFHAWVEIDGVPLNDHDGMTKQWDTILRIPKSNNIKSKKMKEVGDV